MALGKITDIAENVLDTHSKYPTYKSAWLFKYQFSRQFKRGTLAGKNAIDPLTVLQNPDFHKLPYPGSHDCKTEADPCLVSNISDWSRMDIHLFNVLYQQTNKLSWMMRFNYIAHTVHMSDKITTTVPITPYQLNSTGISDIQLFFTNRLAQTKAINIDLTLGVNFPSGNIDKTSNITDMSENYEILPYDMQLGSGTYDIITELAISGSYYGFEYGGGIYRIFRTGLNNQYYSLGDVIKVKSWARYTFSFGTQFRLGLTQNVWSPIEGRDMRLSDNPRYSGGKRLDGLVGIGQKTKYFGIYLDYAYPLLQYLNGVQSKTTGTVSLGLEFKYF